MCMDLVAKQQGYMAMRKFQIDIFVIEIRPPGFA